MPARPDLVYKPAHELYDRREGTGRSARADDLEGAERARGQFSSVAVSRWELVVTKLQGRTTLTVRGPETRATQATVPPDGEFFGIAFDHGAFMPDLPLATWSKPSGSSRAGAVVSSRSTAAVR